MPKFSKDLILFLPQWVREHLWPVLLTLRTAGFVLAALALWVFARLADEILSQQSFTFDQQILLALREVHKPILDVVMLGFTYMGEPVTLLALCSGLAIWFVNLGERSPAITLVVAALGATGLDEWLKHLFGRARPMLWERIVDVGQYSFPSGHAMISMVSLGMMGYLLTTKFPQWRIRVIGLTVFLIIGIGLSRLYLGVHWPSDIIAGYAAGMVWLLTCIVSLELWQQQRMAAQKLKPPMDIDEPGSQISA
jgi:undecaprenyl-diphosphatase